MKVTGLRVNKPLPWRKLCQIPLQKAVAVRYVNVSTACFLRFPAALWQLGTPARVKDHFPGLYRGNTHSLWPSKTTFPHKSWPERHLEWEEQWHGVCKSRAAHGNTKKNISKTKGRHGASFASYCLEKVENKGQQAIKTKNVSGKMKRNYARDKRYVSRETKECGREYDGKRCAEQKRAAGEGLELVRWIKGVSRKRKEIASQNKRKPHRKTKENRIEALELVRGTKGSQSRDKWNRGAKQNKPLEKAWN